MVISGGENRLHDLIIAHGITQLIDHVEALIAYARKMTERLFPPYHTGCTILEDMLEGDGQRETSIPIKVRLSVLESQMVVDFSESSPQVVGNVNAVGGNCVLGGGICRCASSARMTSQSWQF